MCLVFALRVATVRAYFKTCSVNIVPKLIVFWRKASYTCLTCLLLKFWLGCVPKSVPGGQGWLSELPMICVSPQSAIPCASPALQLSLCEQDGN